VHFTEKYSPDKEERLLMSSQSLADQVLSFWFGDDGKPKQFWFQSTLLLDQQICDQFKNVYEKASNGELDALLETPEGTLALVIILDQFPRNMFRNSPQAFATDQKACEIAKLAISMGFDKSLGSLQKSFLYLPFEHSERLEDQKKSVELCTTLGGEDLEYALHHHVIIERFGRFPHRNAILLRESTLEEIEFLKEAPRF